MLDDTLRQYAYDTENPALNYKLALEYEKIGQTAAAVSYFLRSAERTNSTLLQYACLIKLGHCFDNQKNRAFTAKSMYRMAMTIMPERPEAYYFLAKFLAFESNYSECYSLCKLASHNCKNKNYNDISVGYPGDWGLIHYEALSSWWYGKIKDSLKLFRLLRSNYWTQMDEYHRYSVQQNLSNIESKIDITEEAAPTSTNEYTKRLIERLYPEYDVKYGNWGWCSLNKAGCFIDYVDDVCKRFENPVCVEIGVYAGRSVLPVALELQRHKKGKLYAIDPWTNEEATKGYEGLNYQYWNNISLNYMYGIYNEAITSLGLKDYIDTIVSASDDAPVIQNISFLHIDGQHTEQAIRDVKKYASQVSIGGYCVVDDVRWGEVAKTPLELEKMGFVHIHSVDESMVFKKCYYNNSTEES